MSGPSRVAHLDGLRGVAILAVLAVHWGAPRAQGLPVPLLGGYIGVELFFVLSGYLICGVLLRTPDAPVGELYRRFQRGRARRLLPALVVFVVVATVLVALVGRPVGAREVVVNGLLALGQAGSITNALDLATLVPFEQTWTLAVEWYFYLLVPVALLAWRRRGRFGTPRSRATGAGAAALVLYLASLPWGWQWFYFGPSSRAAQLVAGTAIALYLWRPAGEPEPRTPRRPALFGGLGAAALLFVAGWTLVGPPQQELVYRLVGFPLVTAASVVLVLVGRQAPTSPVTRVLQVRPLVLLGRVSYSVYLWHLLPVYLIDPATVGVPAPVAAGLSVAVLVPVVWASYVLLERPALRRPGPQRPGPGRHAVPSPRSEPAPSAVLPAVPVDRNG